MKDSNSTIIKIDGYTIEIQQDDCTESPWSDCDGLAPVLAFALRDRAFTEYGECPSTARDFCALVPGNLSTAEYLKLLDDEIEEDEFADYKENWDYPDSAAFAYFADELFSAPQSFTFAKRFLDFASRCLTAAGIVHHLTDVTGPCQGDRVLLLAIATPEFVKVTWCPPDKLQQACEGACKLWGQWAWGDVWGFLLNGPDGEEIDGSCWGFFGSDHEESGLMEHARSAIESHKTFAEKEPPEQPTAISVPMPSLLIELPTGSWVDPANVRAISVLAQTEQEQRPRVAVVHKDGWEIIYSYNPVELAAELASKVNQFRDNSAPKMQILPQKL